MVILGSAPSSDDPLLPVRPEGGAGARREQDAWLRRRGIERQLHDGPALRISALALRLGLLRTGAQPDAQPDAQHTGPPAGQAAPDRIGELQDELHTVLEELRDVTDKIYPPLLDRAGLGPALREVAAQVDTPVAVTVSGGRFGPAAEGAAYFALATCLATLPAGAQALRVQVRREDGRLTLSVSGPGAGHAELMSDQARLISDQARPLGGTVEVTGGDEPGTGTITARIPCE